jgi:hypothetical protein
MKITMDVTTVAFKSGNATERSSAKVSSDIATERALSLKVQRDRAIAEALAMAQTSRQIVQKAIDISARLRSMAFETMTGGKVEFDLVGGDIAGFKSVISNYGENIFTPIVGVSGGSFTREAGELMRAYDDMSSGKKISPEVFNSFTKTFESQAEKIDSTIKRALLSFPGIRLSGSAQDFENLNRNTASMIAKSSYEAISAQGNMSQERALSLI